MKPTRYFVRYERNDAWVERDFERLAEARRFAARCKTYAEVVERLGLRDITPPGDPPGLLWDWDDERVHS